MIGVIVVVVTESSFVRVDVVVRGIGTECWGL